MRSSRKSLSSPDLRFNYYFGRIRTLFSRSKGSSDIELTSTPRKLSFSDKTRMSRSHGNLFSCLSPQTCESEMPRSKSLSFLGNLSNVNTILRSDSLLKFTTASESISVIGPVMSDENVTSREIDVTSSRDMTSVEQSELTLAQYLTPGPKTNSTSGP